MYFESHIKADCCGCTACSNACPKGAITMTADECGFVYPVIDEASCVNCGLCRRICIFKEKIKDSDNHGKYYAIRSKDDDLVLKSSSGGFFTLAANEIFRRGGVVYGVAYGEGFSVEHSRAENMDGASAFRTSKYVQSNTDGIFDSVRSDLTGGKTVYFTGTPCQVAGLLAYLSAKGTNTTNLYTCDNICHGVSSPLVFGDYMESLKKHVDPADTIASVNMRYKRGNKARTVLQITTQKGDTVPVDDYSYYRLFLNRIANRPSCFECKFTSYTRVGDLSVGDFWNDSEKEFPYDSGIGMNEVLVNTAKGQELFDIIKQNALSTEVSREKAWQPHLEYATQKPKKYENFWEEYLVTNDREQIIRKYLKPSPLFKVINTVTPILRKTGLYSLFGKLYKVVLVKKK